MLYFVTFNLPLTFDGFVLLEGVYLALKTFQYIAHLPHLKVTWLTWGGACLVVPII